MPAKTLRVIQPAKYTGIFTRKEIERAVRIVTERSAGESARRQRSGSKSVTQNGSHAGR